MGGILPISTLEHMHFSPCSHAGLRTFLDLQILVDCQSTLHVCNYELRRLVGLQGRHKAAGGVWSNLTYVPLPVGIIEGKMPLPNFAMSTDSL